MVRNLNKDLEIPRFSMSWTGFFLTTTLAGAFHSPKRAWTPDFSFLLPKEADAGIQIGGNEAQS
jgi:hypothetical protein